MKTSEDYYLVRYNKKKIDELIEDYENKMIEEYNTYLKKHVSKIKKYGYDLKIEFGRNKLDKPKDIRRFYDSYYSGIYGYIRKDNKLVYYDDGEPDAYKLFIDFAIVRIEKYCWSKGKNKVYFIPLDAEEIEEEFGDIYKCLDDKEHIIIEN